MNDLAAIAKPDADKGSYRAFISYSHRDSGTARWLHRQLEFYRVPSRIVGRTTATGMIGKSVGRIFRDRDELAVSADLSGKINAALKESQFLIVLCSTNSACSKWVNQEVVNFKRLRGPESIIAVILDGEPFAAGIPGREAEECLVPALRFEVDRQGVITDRRAEPVAADLRPGKDGKRLAKAKILAGLLGIELDELIRREVQRRNRQLFATTCIMSAIVIAMGVLLALAVTSRNQAVEAGEAARRQKDQAEGLIDFMLGDLRDKLKPVGRLDSLDAVGRHAASYFESLRPDEIDAESRARLARTKLLSGEVLYAQGHAQEAAAQFDSAYTLTSALQNAEPERPERIFDHAQSEYWVGYGKFRNARYADAEQYFLRYAALAESLVARDPKNFAWKAELASAFTNLGAVHTKLLRTAEALTDFKRAAVVQQDVIDHQPSLATITDVGERSRQLTKVVSLNFDLGQILAWEAGAQRVVGNIETAVKLIERQLDVHRVIEELDPKNAGIPQARLTAFRDKGRLLLERGEPVLALADFRSAIGIAESLYRLDGQNKRWMQLFARCQLDAAEALFDLNRFGESRQLVEAALSAGRNLLLGSGINRAVQIEVVNRAVTISAQLHVAERSYDQAGKALAELANNTGAIFKVAPDNLDTLLMNAEGQILAGDIEDARGHPTDAAEHWRRAAGMADRLGVIEDLRPAIVVTRARQRLRAKNLTEVVRHICATGYRRGEFRELCQKA